ncbi:hypothetical protein T09_3269 [Trichinella sp. T9]|nr:hypothetical protein T09_3269 [Trichinella sp. T9]
MHLREHLTGLALPVWMAWRTTLVRLRSSSDVDNTSANFLRIAARADRCLPLDSCSQGSIFSIASCAVDSALTRATAWDFRNGMLPYRILRYPAVGS